MTLTHGTPSECQNFFISNLTCKVNLYAFVTNVCIPGNPGPKRPKALNPPGWRLQPMCGYRALLSPPLMSSCLHIPEPYGNWPATISYLLCCPVRNVLPILYVHLRRRFHAFSSVQQGVVLGVVAEITLGHSTSILKRQ